MKVVCTLAALAVLAVIPAATFSAEDGAALYASKCSMCHGDKGENESGTTMPAINKTSMTVEKMVEYLTKGDKSKIAHADPIADLTEAQAKAIAEHVKKLKK